jgi:hypothetical protein
MFRHNASLEKSPTKPGDHLLTRYSWLRTAPAVSLLVLSLASPAAIAAQPQPFKFANIHFETNSSACDMGIQILFDTDGVTEGKVEDPNEQVVYSFQTALGMEQTHDQTEGFQEHVEPPITDLEDALGCEPSPDAISLAQLLTVWPAGIYDFEGTSGGVLSEGTAKLTHKVPAGPVITAPADGAIVPHDQPLVIRWRKVTTPIIPTLGPVTIVGYHVLVKDLSPPASPGRVPAQLDADVSKDETTFTVPKQYLEPNRMYEFEILATEKGNNQTITEGGVFCTPPVTAPECELE